MNSFVLSGKVDQVKAQLEALEGFEKRAYLRGIQQQLNNYAEQGYHTLGWHLLGIAKIIAGSPSSLEYVEQVLGELKREQEREQYQAWQGLCESKE